MSSHAARIIGDHTPSTFLEGSPVFSAEAQKRGLPRLAEIALDQCMNKIAELAMSADPPPTEVAANVFSEWLPRIFDRGCKVGGWAPPHITCSDLGEIVCEWWKGEHKLTIYFGDNGPEFIKVWGTDIETEMEDGQLTEGWGLTSLWLWLHSKV
jgi:hypothetical protein